MHSVLAVFFFKGTSSRSRTGTRRGINISGVDFWHAVEFSRNGSFLRNRFTGPSGLSLRCVSDFSRCFPVGITNPVPRTHVSAVLGEAVVPTYWTPLRGANRG